jgi:hypothetical protein
MTKKLSTRYIDIDDTGGSFSLPNNYLLAQADKYIVRIATGDTGTLTGNVTITSAGNLENGIYYNIEFEDTFVLGANNFTIFGKSLTATQLLAYPLITVRDNGTGYEVYLEANSFYTTTETSNIVDKAVTLNKMADLARGFVIVGNSSTRPTALDAKTSGRILLGDGTDLLSVALSGDATLSGAGALTIANDAIDNNKLANITRGSIKVGGASNAPTDLDAKTNGYILIGDGTDLKSVAVSGDITITSAGVVTIATDGVTNAKLANMVEGTVKVGGASNAPTDLDNSASGAIIIGNGTGVGSYALTGAVTLSSLGVTALSNNAVTTAKVLDDNITTAKLDANSKYKTIYIEVSFETGELGVFPIKTDFGGTVVSMYAYATKAIAGTDNGTIVLKNNAGTTMTTGTITYTASDARGTQYTVAPSANNTFATEQTLTVTTAKTTAGGKVLLAIKCLKA